MTVVAVIGAMTALFAASIGMTQFDIKRVLAYSTISQLGYMFMACGVGAFATGIFHLMTHAFFKALLFMAAGSVMHALAGELDMRKMGNLKRYMPYTHFTYIFGTLAIAGIFPFAGFFSKDEILYFSFMKHPIFWVVGAVAALMTSFYMFRSVYMTFYGDSRMDPHVESHVHESPPVMTVPLVILAALSLVGGLIGIPIIEGGHKFGDFLAPVFSQASSIMTHGAHHAGGHDIALEVVLMAVSLAVAVIGLLLARWMYLQDPRVPERVIERFPGWHDLVYNKYRVDELYDVLFVNSIVRFSSFLWRSFDAQVVDGAVNLTGWVTRVSGRGLRLLQSGFIKDYALSILVGALVILGYLVLS
jgi:NADH-quinone oxidoreductase subunit L